MSYLLHLKEFVRPIISNRVVNIGSIWILKRLGWLFSDRLLVRVPVNGVVSINIGAFKKLSLYSNADDPMVSGLCFKGLDGYEPETIGLFRELAAKANVLIDIGANTGIYSLLAAVENPDCKVIAFEPAPRIFRRLRLNQNLNQATNLSLVQCVLTNFDGSSTLYIPKGKMPTSSSTAVGHRRAVRSIEVEATKLDTYIDEQSIDRVDLIKIDTETTEPQVLEGAARLIARDRPAIICEILRPKVGHLIQNILDGFGYDYYWITADGLIKTNELRGDPKFKYLNYLFLQPNQSALIQHLLLT